MNKSKVTLSAGPIGGRVVDWTPGQSTITVDGCMYRICTEQKHGVDANGIPVTREIETNQAVFVGEVI